MDIFEGNIDKTYSTDKVDLILGDSFEVLKQIKPKSINMIFADPPYFLSSDGISCSGGKQVSVNKGEWDRPLSIQDRIDWNVKWLKLAYEVLKDDGSIWISGTLHNIHAIGVALELANFSIINDVTWVKLNPPPNLACRCLTHSTETIIWARKQLTPKKKGKHTFNYKELKEDNGGKQQKDVWYFSNAKPSEKKFGKHPTQKPLDLLLKIVETATHENDIVLDPFCGSSTTGVACVKMNRKYIGIDNVPEYIELSKRRLDANEKRF
jgi:site-specific DNA-methyltransferase (adenine-specific)